MSTAEQLRERLRAIHSKGYGAYRSLRGEYSFPRYRLSIDHVQGDPFAAPSRVSVEMALSDCRLSPTYASNRDRQIAAGDYLTRAFAAAATRVVTRRRGSGRSGEINIASCGQQILERNSVLVTPERLQARFTMGLPAAGRRILARDAEAMFFDDLARIVEQSLFVENLPPEGLSRHVETFEDQQSLRAQLRQRDLVAFVGEGAILPRRSGIDDRPLDPDQTIRFEAPPELRCRLERPFHGPIEGMGLPPGVHLIVGGGFHGKSTLLRALERGVYNHIPGDGREWVLTDESACKIRAEDGRSITHVDISPFIGDLPMGRDTRSFSTENASGSTSQAANIVEALELGARLLLIDEDTSASNFMQRDARMQHLIAKSQEPITPLIDRVRELYQRHSVSTILVTGGSGDYFDVADRVIQMESYRPREVTARVRDLVARHPSGRRVETPAPFDSISHRVPLREGFDARRGRRPVKIDARGRDTIVFGRQEISLAHVEQLVDRGQTRAIGWALHVLERRFLGPGRSLRQVLEQLDHLLDAEGLDVLSQFRVGNLVRPRIFELAAAINRLRSLRTMPFPVPPPLNPER